DAQRPGDELQQGPAPGLVERIEPSRELRRQLGFAECRKGGDDVRESRGTACTRPLHERGALPSLHVRSTWRGGGGGEGRFGAYRLHCLCGAAPPPPPLPPASRGGGGREARGRAPHRDG